MITKKTKKRKSYQAIAVFIVLGLFGSMIFGFIVFSSWKISQKRTELKAQIEVLKKEIEILEKKNQEFQAGISQISKEDHLEKEARENLGLKKPGEEVVVVLPPEEVNKEKDKQEKNLWQKFLDPVRNFFEDL
ncbi:septum formation initiator family protein [Patescibacteria group bacterium]|nr:septum formation initiator family protein [Patescibacteria group bacterium]